MWKVRPHLTFGTVEFSLFDVHGSLKRTGAFIALAQALVGQIIEDFDCGKLEQPVYDTYLLDGYWKARRFGLDCDIICPFDGVVRSMRKEVKKMLNFVKQFAEKKGTGVWLKEIEDILENGNGAEQMLDLAEELGDDLVALQKSMISSVEYELEEELV